MPDLTFHDTDGNVLRVRTIADRDEAYAAWDAAMADFETWPRNARAVSITDGALRGRSFTRVDPVVSAADEVMERLDAFEGQPTRTPNATKPGPRRIPRSG